MPLFDDGLVENLDRSDHEQAQILDDVRGERIVRDGVSIDIESKTLALNAPAIRELHREIETHAFFSHCISSHEEDAARRR